MDRYDVIAIGAGAAGLVTSAGAAGLGAKTALIERDRLGGECLWTGCVPSKALIAAANAAAAIRAAHAFGVSAGEPVVNWPAVRQRVHEARLAIAPHDSPERFRGLGVDVIHGTARFVESHVLDIDGRRVHGRHIVIATGSRPAIPDIPGIRDVPFLTNENVFEMEYLPRRLIILGAGAIGLELGQAFVRLGVRVTILERAPMIMQQEDEEVRATIEACIRDEDVDLRLGADVTRVERRGSVIVVEIRAARGNSNGVETVEADALLVATGRRPGLDDLDLHVAGIDADANGIRVAKTLRTNVDGVWAAGDITGGPRFTHVADYQARLVLRNALFPFSAKADYNAVPRVTYTDPEFARVGLTEAEARERYGAIEVWTRPFAAVDRAIADRRITGMVKLIGSKRGRILGAHVVGYGASMLIAEAALALRHGLGMNRLANTVHAYPTYAEAWRQAAEQHSRSRFTGAVKAMVQRFVRRVH